MPLILSHIVVIIFLEKIDKSPEKSIPHRFGTCSFRIWYLFSDNMRNFFMWQLTRKKNEKILIAPVICIWWHNHFTIEPHFGNSKIQKCFLAKFLIFSSFWDYLLPSSIAIYLIKFLIINYKYIQPPIHSEPKKTENGGDFEISKQNFGFRYDCNVLEILSEGRSI